jgi:hypothetical protein
MDALYFGVSAEALFWLACAALYVIDHVKLLSARELLVVQRGRGHWAPLFPLNGLKIGKWPVVVLNPLTPASPVVRMAWLTATGAERRQLAITRSALRSVSRSVIPYRMISVIVCVMLFVAGPLLTRQIGFDHTLLLLGPIYLVCLAALTLFALLSKPLWQVGWPTICGMVLECAICPGYFANSLPKNIALLLPHSRRCNRSRACVWRPADDSKCFFPARGFG